MVYYKEQKKFFEGKLTVFKKSASNNWYGRCWVDGKGKELSSRTQNFNKAKSILTEWYRELQYKLKNEIPVHDLLFNKLFKQYIAFRKENKKTDYSRNIRISFTSVLKSFFHNRKINSINKKTIIDYLSWRVKKFKKENKKDIAYFTLVNDLMMISGFMNWAFENGHREKKIALSKKWISEVTGIKNKDTSRTYFTIKEYDKLLSTSRKRIKEYNSGHTLTKFRREYLHQYIIFMVHSGLRTGEAYGLKFSDVKMVKHKQANKCYCELNVSGKTGRRTAYTTFGSYFAIKKIKELLRSHLNKTVTDVAQCKVFQQKFRRGLNDLLADANLKKQMDDGKETYRDSYSFRHTYISWAIIRGESVKSIELNCGTSGGVIQDFYTKHISIKQFKKQLTTITNVKSLHLNGQ